MPAWILVLAAIAVFFAGLLSGLARRAQHQILA